jgi:O-antigen ligase
MVLSDKKSFFYKTMAASVLAAVIISLSMAGSRGGVLFSLLNSSLVLLFYVKGGWKRLIFIAFICVFLFTTYLAVDLYFYEQVQRSFARIGEKDFTEDVRWSIWRGAVLIALNNPGGIGLGGENFAGWLHHYSGYYFEHAHNAFLSIAAHNGILGLVFFLSLIWTQLVRLVSTMKSLPNEKRFVSAFVLSVITGYLLSSMTNGTFINNIKINHFFALFLGVCAFLNYEATEQTSDTVPVGANRHEI